MTLIQRFWQRVFNNPQAGHMVLAGEPGEGLVKVNWQQAGYAVATLISFLRRRGIKKGDQIAILGWNSPEWVWANLAIQTIGAVTIPIYPNSKPDSVNYILKDSGALLTFVAEHEQAEKVKIGQVVKFNEVLHSLSARLPESNLLCWFVDNFFEAELRSLPGVEAELSALRAASKDSGGFAWLADDDLATIIYTSGSSGTPKGCLITHGNIAAKMQAMSGVGLGMSAKTDRVLSYLPLAHVLANIDEMNLCLWEGVEVAFSPIDKMADNLRVFQPTMVSGVPAVWEKIYNKSLHPEQGAAHVLDRLFLWKPLFKFALSTAPASGMGRFFDKHIFAELRARLGGKLRFGVSGGAPAAPHVLQFLKRIGIEIIEGYGATETLGGIITNRPSWAPGSGPKNKVGSVGYAIPGCQVRIVVQPGEEELGVGEIQMRGPQIFKGYRNLPEATAEAFTEDGWFRSGDLGRIDADGFVYITGRMNGMYKTAGGKYVSREKIEMAFKPFPIVQYVLPVAHGRKYVVALVFLNQELSAKLAGAAPSGTDSAAFYAGAADVQKAVAEALAGANATLEQWETIKKQLIMPIAPTLENGIVTETLKIRSKVLLKRFEKEIDTLYEAK